MKRHTKLLSEEQSQQAAEQNLGQNQSLEFHSVEEMLRHDASHTPLPPTIAHRLEKSIGPLESSPARSWWQRFFGGSKS